MLSLNADSYPNKICWHLLYTHELNQQCCVADTGITAEHGEKVFQAESHAAQLNDSSAVLDGYGICCWKCLPSLTLIQKLRQAERVENHFQV